MRPAGRRRRRISFVRSSPVSMPHPTCGVRPGLIRLSRRSTSAGDTVSEEQPVSAIWPDIPYPAWRETCSALHLYTQIVGKYRLARAPWVNHSWHATLYVDARGLTTSLVPDVAAAIEISFDLLGHAVIGRATDG